MTILNVVGDCGEYLQCFAQETVSSVFVPLAVDIFPLIICLLLSFSNPVFLVSLSILVFLILYSLFLNKIVSFSACDLFSYKNVLKNLFSSFRLNALHLEPEKQG